MTSNAPLSRPQRAAALIARVKVQEQGRIKASANTQYIPPIPQPRGPALPAKRRRVEVEIPDNEDDVDNPDSEDDVELLDSEDDFDISDSKHDIFEQAPLVASDEGISNIDAADENSPWVGENGLTRIGPQPQKECPFVLSGPLSEVETVIKRMCFANLAATDADPGELEVRMHELEMAIRSRLMPHGDGHVRMLRDYTGTEMSLAPGAWSRGLEAFYPFAKQHDECLYHVSSNDLPLSHNAHRKQLEEWGQWDLPKQQAVLEVLRTGKFRPAIQEELGSWNIRELIGETSARGLLLSKLVSAMDISWETTYGWLQQVATEYGLTADEFKDWCTARSPSNAGERVFYPFHVSSRPEVEELQWDWGTLYATAVRMLRNMRSRCNRWAEQAGEGEAKMDALRPHCLVVSPPMQEDKGRQEQERRAEHSVRGNRLRYTRPMGPPGCALA
ncbi:uncharacterized protein B0T15DRAFT_548212 [Chaetomium strumarium]|uniref:Uncharacterized protein n=1 Tax=Chaetomium strumarium TaxID=1170767 RepID=A0AAJ0M6N0_9PEZI|nr:hypothetical protein B0T15DRAFT_548212 [Chaetomium strumarium]